MTPSLSLPVSTGPSLSPAADPAPTWLTRSEAFAEDLDPPPLPARLPHTGSWRPAGARPALFTAAVAAGAVLTGVVNVMFALPV